MFANTKESGLEMLIVKWLVEHNGYEEGSNADYNKEYAIDEPRLFRFLQDTQPEQMDKLGVFKFEQKKRQFLNRLQGEIAKRGIIDVLRNGIKVYPVDLIMFYLTPTEKNAKAREMFEKNIFSVTRQLRYAQDAGKLALDMCVFINGLPVITFELKNQLTKQNVDDAVQQYKDDRDPRESLFTFKRCMVHFAVDDARVKFCTKLAGQDSWFLPFDKGYNDGVPRASTRSPAEPSRKVCLPRPRQSARKSWRKPFGRIAACRSITRATTPQRSGAACGLKLTASPTSATTPPRAMRGSLNTTSSRPSARSSLSSSRPSTSRECITT